MPKVSVIIPVYNAEKYVEECVNSVLCQTEYNIELIAVDDGSVDGSNAILQRMAGTDSRITVVRQDNKGLPGARNTGVDHAKGDYVLFVDADDTIEPNMVEVMYAETVKHCADVVVCAYNNIHTYKNKTYVRSVSDDVNDYLFGDFVVTLHKQQLFHPAWNKLYRRDIVDNIRSKNYTPGQDAVLNLEIAGMGVYKYFYVNKPLYNFYSRSKGSITNSYKPSIIESYKTIYSLWNNLISNNELTINKDDFLSRMYLARNISILTNIYKFRSPYSFKGRTKYIREVIFKDEELNQFMKNYQPRGIGERLYAALYSLGNACMTNLIYTVSWVGYRKFRLFMK